MALFNRCILTLKAPLDVAVTIFDELLISPLIVVLVAGLSVLV